MRKPRRQNAPRFALLVFLLFAILVIGAILFVFACSAPWRSPERRQALPELQNGTAQEMFDQRASAQSSVAFVAQGAARIQRRIREGLTPQEALAQAMQENLDAYASSQHMVILQPFDVQSAIAARRENNPSPRRENLTVAQALAFLVAINATDDGSAPARICQAVLIPDGTIIQVGDLHGDAATLADLLIASGFVERRLRGERLFLVFTGDYIDRGPESLETMDLLLRLASSDARVSAGVIMLRGNHETSGVRFAPGDRSTFAEELRRKTGDGSKELLSQFQTLFEGLPIVAFAPDAMYVHGGVPLAENGTLLDGPGGPLNEFLREERDEHDSAVRTMLWGEIGEGDAPASISGRIRIPQRLFDEYARAIGAHRIFRGHQAFPERASPVILDAAGKTDIYTTYSSRLYYGGAIGVEIYDSRTGAVIPIAWNATIGGETRAGAAMAAVLDDLNARRAQ